MEAGVGGRVGGSSASAICTAVCGAHQESRKDTQQTQFPVRFGGESLGVSRGGPGYASRGMCREDGIILGEEGGGGGAARCLVAGFATVFSCTR